MDETQEVGARLTLRGREQFQRDSKAASESIDKVGTSTKHAANMADSSAKRFGMFGSKVKTAGVTATEAMGTVGAKAGIAFGDGFTRDAQGRLHDANGHFVKSGSVIGNSLGLAARTEADAEIATTGASPGVRSRLARNFATAGAESGTKFGESMRERAFEYVKVLGGTMLAFFAAEKVKETITEGLHLADDMRKAQQGTNAALKSTHDASHMSAKGIHELSEELSGVSKQSPIATQGMENMLLTFPKIKKGNEVFRQTAMLSQDLAARLGTALPSAARMMGRALNDPTKGMTALGRVGIRFSDDQTNVIKSLVATGNLAKAQAIILNEVHKRVGGAAAAAVTPTDRLRYAWEEFELKMGKKIRPELYRFENWMSKHGIPDIEKFGGVVRKQLAPPLHAVVNFMRDHGIPAIKTFFGFLDKHQGTIKQIAKWFLVFYGVLKGYYILIKLIAIATRAWAFVQALLNGTLDANPIGLIIIAIAALTTGIIYAYKHSETFRTIVQGAFHGVMVAVDFLKDHWKLFVTIFASLIFGPLGFAIAFMLTHFKTTKKVFWEVVNGIETGAKAVAHFFMKYIASPAEAMWGSVKKYGGKVWDFFSGLPGKIKTAFVDLAKILLAPYQTAFHLIAVAWNNSVGRIGFHTPGWLGPLGHKGFSIPKIPDPGMPALARGGPVAAGTMYLVGERGPELFVSKTQGQVIPNQRIAPRGHVSVEAVGQAGMEALSGGLPDGQPIVLQVELDRKVVAEAVYTYTRGRVARK